MARQNMILVKIGGVLSRDTTALSVLLEGIASFQQRSGDSQWLLVHGGGAEVSRISKTFGFTPVFKDGIRQTSPGETELMDMGLAGLVNTAILRQARSAGLRAVGISGVDAGLFRTRAISEENRTGRVTGVDSAIVTHLTSAGYFPVISPVSSDDQGAAVNINADDAASALAEALQPGTVLFLSDIPGVLPSAPDSRQSNADYRAPIRSLNRQNCNELIESGVISGGMIPKVTNALDLVETGISKVIVGTINSAKSGLENLDLLLEGNSGTTFVSNITNTPHAREAHE